VSGSDKWRPVGCVWGLSTVFLIKGTAPVPHDRVTFNGQSGMGDCLSQKSPPLAAGRLRYAGIRLFAIRELYGVNRYSGPPMTFGNAVAARVRLIGASICRHQVEPDPAEMADCLTGTSGGSRYGDDAGLSGELQTRDVGSSVAMKNQRGFRAAPCPDRETDFAL
jgi:hypothetical protein